MVNGTPITTMRYADHAVILSDTAMGLQELLNEINRIGVEYGLTINVNKTKFMIINRTSHNDIVMKK